MHKTDALERRIGRAIHEYLCRRDIIQYLDNEEDCAGLARAILAEMPQFTGAAEVTQVDRDTAERWGTGPVYNMQHLAEFLARHRAAGFAAGAAAVENCPARYSMHGCPLAALPKEPQP